MLKRSLLPTLVLCGLAGAAHAKGPAADADPAKTDAAPFAVTDEEVGDADSFGRNVKWLGVVAGSIRLAGDCTPLPGDPPDEGCVVLSPAPAPTPFRVDDIDSITLPARASRSLLCHWQTPIVSYSAGNDTGSPQTFTLRAQPVYRIESEVLNEPGLVDPNTGLPYAGVLELPLTAIYKSGTRAPGEEEFEVITSTRMCIGSLIKKSTLISSYGLSPAQATRFFRRPITIHLGISGQAQLVRDAQIYFGTRFVGD